MYGQDKPSLTISNSSASSKTCNILLVQSVLYFLLHKMFEMRVWTETAKKLECMRNILYMLYNLQPNHGRFIRITVCFVFAES